MSNILPDLLIATSKAAVSLFPCGAFLAEYLNLAQGYVVNKRLDEWKARVDDVLDKIPKSIDELAQEEEFYSCIQVATIGAMKSYQMEKQQLFANALFSSANNTDISADKKLFYLGLLDSYTLSHILLLKYFSENHYVENTIKKGMATTIYIGGTESPMKGIIENMPSFKNDLQFVKHIVRKLFTDNLILPVDFETPVSKENARSKKTTKYGDEFLNFIKEY